MKGLIYGGKDIIKYETVDDPSIDSPYDVIVKVSTTAICGSDLQVYHDKIKGQDHGTVMGHEFAGEIVEVGDEVIPLTIWSYTVHNRPGTQAGNGPDFPGLQISGFETTIAGIAENQSSAVDEHPVRIVHFAAFDPDREFSAAELVQLAAVAVRNVSVTQLVESHVEIGGQEVHFSNGFGGVTCFTQYLGEGTDFRRERRAIGESAVLVDVASRDQ